MHWPILYTGPLYAFFFAACNVSLLTINSKEVMFLTGPSFEKFKLQIV